jgi:pimeloyl-ACP methyl ester carboxylesterase
VQCDACGMTTARMSTNGIDLAYDTFGDRLDPPVLLVMGLGTQMIAWPEPFCRGLAGQGFFVVRFDNRDVGESTHLDGLPAPSPIAIALHRRRPSYRLEDMAADTIGLISGLGLGPVHLVGASMGGFISQLVALQAPDLVSSLTLIMTSTGARRVGRTSRAVVAAVLRPKPAATREQAIEASFSMFELIRSPGYPFDAENVRDVAGRSYERGYDAAGAKRQLAAVVSQGDRTGALARITAPTLVMHGLSDPLVAISGGIAVAKAIPGARFVAFHGMGHDLPSELWPTFIAEIAALAGAEGVSTGSALA